MIERRPFGQSRNARTDVCTSCSFKLEGFELDGTQVFLCRGCVRDVVDEAGELQDARRQLYEGATWLEWAEAHRRHGKGVIGCPLCGAGHVS